MLMPKNYKRERLENGETFTTSERGNSMTPKIKSGQKFTLEPCEWTNVQVKDMVYCKVGKSYFTHIVKAKNDEKGVLIGNNHGYINGWTKKVFGRVIEVL